MLFLMSDQQCLGKTRRILSQQLASQVHLTGVYVCDHHWVMIWLAGFYPQLCHQLSELVNSSKQMSSSLSQCLTVFIQQEQVVSRYGF